MHRFVGDWSEAVAVCEDAIDHGSFNGKTHYRCGYAQLLLAQRSLEKSHEMIAKQDLPKAREIKEALKHISKALKS